MTETTAETTAKRPAILRGVQGRCEVRFTYTTRDGGTAYISGHFERFIGSPESGVEGIKVCLGSASTLPGKRAGDVASLKLDRIHADPETGLIIPVSKKELAAGTGAARYIRPAGYLVRRALSLSGRTCPGGGNYPQHTEAEFRAMTRAEIEQWIAMAEDELGAWL